MENTLADISFYPLYPIEPSTVSQVQGQWLKVLEEISMSVEYNVI